MLTICLFYKSTFFVCSLVHRHVGGQPPPLVVRSVGVIDWKGYNHKWYRIHHDAPILDQSVWDVNRLCSPSPQQCLPSMEGREYLHFCLSSQARETKRRMADTTYGAMAKHKYILLYAIISGSVLYEQNWTHFHPNCMFSVLQVNYGSCALFLTFIQETCVCLERVNVIKLTSLGWLYLVYKLCLVIAFIKDRISMNIFHQIMHS